MFNLWFVSLWMSIKQAKSKCFQKDQRLSLVTTMKEYLTTLLRGWLQNESKTVLIAKHWSPIGCWYWLPGQSLQSIAFLWWKLFISWFIYFCSLPQVLMEVMQLDQLARVDKSNKWMSECSHVIFLMLSFSCYLSDVIFHRLSYSRNSLPFFGGKPLVIIFNRGDFHFICLLYEKWKRTDLSCMTPPSENWYISWGDGFCNCGLGGRG